MSGTSRRSMWLRRMRMRWVTTTWIMSVSPRSCWYRAARPLSSLYTSDKTYGGGATGTREGQSMGQG